MCRLDGLRNVTVEEPRDDCSDEFVRAIERNRIEMEIAWIRAEDPAGVLDSKLSAHLKLMAKYLKSKAHLKN
jgi:hypothetical protein